MSEPATSPNPPTPDAPGPVAPPRGVFAWLREHVVALVGLVVVAGGAWLGYSLVSAPIAVVAHVVARGEVVAEVPGTGTLEARTRVTVSTKIAGRIAELLADEGDTVAAGAVLLRLDDSDLRQQVEVEEATVAARQATVERLLAEQSAAKATLELATSSHQRSAQLFASGDVSQDHYDRALEALNSAKAGVDRAEAALNEGRKQLIAAQKLQGLHLARLQDTVIVAPFAGLIVGRERDAGDVIVPGSAVLHLVSLEGIHVNAWVDETQMAALRPDLSARVVFRSEPASPMPARLVRVAREADRETREILVEVRPERLPANWAIGQRADVRIETDRRRDVVVVPARFLVVHQGQTGVFVAVDGRAQWRPVVPGIRGRELVEVTDGLAPGETVVAPLGKGPLSAGKRVAPR